MATPLGAALPPPAACHWCESLHECAQNDLTFLRVRTTKNEVMIAPDKEFMLIVVQNPHADDTATVAPVAAAAAAMADDE